MRAICKQTRIFIRLLLLLLIFFGIKVGIFTNYFNPIQQLFTIDIANVCTILKMWKLTGSQYCQDRSHAYSRLIMQKKSYVHSTEQKF